MLAVKKEDAPAVEEQSGMERAKAFLQSLRIPTEARLCLGGTAMALVIAAAGAFWGEEVVGILILAFVLAAFGAGITAVENRNVDPPPRGGDWA